MDIKSEDVEEIKDIGSLYDDGVKLLKTRGGFHIAVGKKEKNSKKASALAAGNHPAIVMHEIGKLYKDFQPIIQKSESKIPPKITEKTEKLNKSMTNHGYRAYSLEKSNQIDFVITQYGLDKALCSFSKEGGNLVLAKSQIKEANPLLADQMIEIVKKHFNENE